MQRKRRQHLPFDLEKRTKSKYSIHSAGPCTAHLRSSSFSSVAINSQFSFVVILRSFPFLSLSLSLTPLQPEAFTLQIDHNVQAVTIGVSVEMRKMKGLLQVGDQRVCCDRVPIKWLAYKGDCRRCGDDASDGFTPQQKELCASLNPDGEKFGATLPPTALCFIKPLRTDVGQGTSSMGIDTFVVGQLVTAAGAQLDQTSFSDSHSQRYNGKPFYFYADCFCF